MNAQCLERLIDPQTKKAIAAYGWLRERKELPNQYWVSIENQLPEFFPTVELAKQHYQTLIKPLKTALQTRGLRGRKKAHAVGK